MSVCRLGTKRRDTKTRCISVLEEFIFLWGKQSQTNSIDRLVHTAYYISYFKGNQPKIKHHPKMNRLPLHNIFQLTVAQNNEASSNLLPSSLQASLEHKHLPLQVKKQRHCLKFSSDQVVTLVAKPIVVSIPELFPELRWAMQDRNINCDIATIRSPIQIRCLNVFSDLQLILEIVYSSFPTQ